MLRTLGSVSSALSVWLPILQLHQRKLANQIVFCVGIGHGATGAVALELGAKQIIGFDLRHALPAITQRETSFVPHEIAQRSKANDFMLADEMFQSGGGDWLATDKKAVLTRHFASVCIIDIEISDEEEQLSNLIPYGWNGTSIIRFLTSEAVIRRLISLNPTCKVYNTSLIRSKDKRQSWIVVLDTSKSIYALGSPDSVIISSCKPFLPKLMKNKETHRLRLNEILSGTQYFMEKGDAAELRDVLDVIDRDISNLDDERLVETYAKARDTLQAFATISHLPESEIADALVQLPVDRARIVSTLISHSVGNRVALVKEYLLSME